MRRLSGVMILVLLLAITMGGASAGGGTSPDSHTHGPVDYDPVDGPPGDDHQHGVPGGHLPASSHNVELVGKVKLTNVSGGIADVGAFGSYAYLAAFSPECTGRPGAQGTGVHVVDISNPANPTKVGFLAAEPNGDQLPGWPGRHDRLRWLRVRGGYQR